MYYFITIRINSIFSNDMTKAGHSDTEKWLSQLFVLCTLIISLGLCQKVDSTSEAYNVSTILDSLLKGYDRRLRPNYGGPPVVIGITVWVSSISSISEVNMDFTLDFYFRQYWKDERLAFKGYGENLAITAEMAKNIWVPDTFFVNEKSAYFHTATVFNSFLRISPHGEVLRSLRLTVTAACPMNLQYFPMDKQICNIEIESFGYQMKDITYEWMRGDDSVGIDANVTLPQFRILGHRQIYREITLSTGNYSRLAVEFHFVRSMGYYLIQIYIPSSLIVIMSWISFWLARDCAPARVAIGVTTVLTMTTLMSSTNSSLPKISYIKSIDIYLGYCFLMVFAAFLEYAAVSYMGKKARMKRERALKQAATTANKGDLNSGLRKETLANCKAMEAKFKDMGTQETSCTTTFEKSVSPEDDAEKGRCKKAIFGVRRAKKEFNPSDIDKYSRIVFPISFICFITVYWVAYLNIGEVLNDELLK